jgi:hypothetical protein
MTRGGTFLAFFLLLELDSGAPFYCFIYGNERQAWVDLRLLLSKCGTKAWVSLTSSCSPSRLTSLTASSRSQTKARVNFTWSVKHLMWSQSPTSITTASASSRARLGKWRYCDCSICSSASYRSSAKASHTPSLMPPSNVHLGVVASTTWRMRWIWSIVGLS